MTWDFRPPKDNRPGRRERIGNAYSRLEVDENSQVIPANILDEELELGLFPPSLRGVQDLLWRHIENDIEGVGFKLNDIHFREFVGQGRPGFLHPSQGTQVRARLHRPVGAHSRRACSNSWNETWFPYEQMLAAPAIFAG